MPIEPYLTRRQGLRLLAFSCAGLYMEGLSFPIKPNPIDLFSRHLEFMDIPSMAVAVRKMGFDGIDLTVREGGHISPARVEQELPRAVQSIRKEGLRIDCITTAIISTKSPHVKSILNTASSLGINRYRMGWMPYDKTKTVQDNLLVFKKDLEGLAVLNEQHRIRAEYQNHSGTDLGAALWDLWVILKDVPSDWVGCRFDIRHAMVEGYHAWVRGLDVLAPYIKSIGIKDFKWTSSVEKDYIEDVPLGKGVVDFPSFSALLREKKISCPMTLYCEYGLGGAEHGKKPVDFPEKEIFGSMERDLAFLRQAMG